MRIGSPVRFGIAEPAGYESGSSSYDYGSRYRYGGYDSYVPRTPPRPPREERQTTVLRYAVNGRWSSQEVTVPEGIELDEDKTNSASVSVVKPASFLYDERHVDIEIEGIPAGTEVRLDRRSGRFYLERKRERH